MHPELRLGALTLPTYFLFVSVAAVAGCWWFVRRADARNLMRTVALDLVLITLGAGFVGARAFHVFYEEPDYYRANPMAVLHVWNGGFVFLGGFLAAVFAFMWFCQWRREPFWVWADAAARPISLAYAIGRLGCLFNGCCFGRVCPYPWAISINGLPRHPAPLYASAWELVWVLLLGPIERRLRMPGATFHVWLVGHALGRIVMESFRDDPRGPAIAGLSIGTWISLGLASLAATHLAYQLNQVPPARSRQTKG